MNITQLTTDYIFAHPYIVECLKKNIINYSKLARTISGELNLFQPKDFDAILVACRRVADKLRESRKRTNTISQEIKKIKIDIQTKKVLFSISKEEFLKKEIRNYNIILGEKYVTIVADQSKINELKKIYPQASYIDELAQITLYLTQNFSELYGALSYFSGIFYDNNVNIVDLISLSKEVLIFICEKDIPRIVRHLRF